VEFAEALLLAAGEVQDVRIRARCSGDYPKHRECSRVAIDDGLEHHRSERRIGIRSHGITVGGLPGLAVGRRRQQANRGLHECFDAEFRCCCAAEDRCQLSGAGRKDEALRDFGVRELTFFEVFLEQGIVALRDRLDELRAGVGGRLGELARNLRFSGRRRCAHAQQIDDALEIGRLADRQRDDHRVGAHLLQRVDGCFEITSLLVHRVDEHESRNFLRLTELPHALGSHLWPGGGRDQEDCSVERAERDPPIGLEVGVPRCVDEGEVLAGPVEGEDG